ncbi:MAG: hypothetical protein ACRD2L_24835, partial [Terriglobia bacterium]
FGIFFTPVFYETTNLGPKGSQLLMLNPLAPILEGFRLAIVEHHNLFQPLVFTSVAGLPMTAWHPWFFLYAGAWAVLGLLASWLMFHKLECVYAEYI